VTYIHVQYDNLMKIQDYRCETIVVRYIHVEIQHV
jgi:hypothetical protein